MYLVLVEDEKGNKEWFEATNTFVYGILTGETVIFNGKEWTVSYIIEKD